VWLTAPGGQLSPLVAGRGHPPGNRQSEAANVQAVNAPARDDAAGDIRHDLRGVWHAFAPGEVPVVI